MEPEVIIQKISMRAIGGVLLIIVLLLLVAKCVSDSREKARQEEAVATAEGFAKIIHETLAGRTTLIVQEAIGTLEVRSVNHGAIFDTSQKSKIPYTVQYSVDLSKVGLSQIRYDETTKTMFVEIPNIVVSPPNIDESKKKILERHGVWTSRDASEKLAFRTSKLAIAGATASANQSEKIRRAQDSARINVDRLLELPLRATGRSDLNVVVRFPTDGVRNGERWDVSPSIEQVLAQRDVKK